MNDTNHSPKGRTLPRHIAIIMDGNGRWAKQRGLNRVFGHKEGANAVRRIVPEYAVQSPLFGPPSVSVHDDGNVTGKCAPFR